MPISPEIQALERRLLALPRTKRLAFSAACAARVVVVHDFDGYAESDDLERASELVWKVALGGKASPAAIKKARKLVTGAMPESAEDEPTYSATAFSVVAVLNALDVVEEVDPQAVVRVSRNEYDAYEALGEDAGRDHEQAWQTTRLQAHQCSPFSPVFARPAVQMSAAASMPMSNRLVRVDTAAKACRAVCEIEPVHPFGHTGSPDAPRPIDRGIVASRHLSACSAHSRPARKVS